ncbi:uncharacterized protein BX664DRAFT_334348 [Halteromyces radiatus]|uniref:uncharacterized protein n=1 Tax=Halteromyces radiatus TaxID=101107 RepID=UPI0022202B0E|nr:uncharacterized protein BX664DRAFT_334348 [Halteromyces radiatus]KAI8089973.1 hypothetical protein BX664DRAFT_334348 [Halteromyces radiatus]
MGKGFTLEVPVNVPANMPWLSRVKTGFHFAQLAMIFLTICVVAPLISTENKYYGGSQPGPNYTLAICILSIVVPVILIYFPWAYEHQNKFKKIGKFALKPRTNMIFTSFNSVVWATCGIAMSVHANNPSHCALDSNLQKTYGDDYVSAWATQCNLGKATAAFAWLTCIMWIGSWICTMIIFWNEKQIIQQNIKETKQNRLSVLEQQQQQEVGGNSTYRTPGYYGDEEDDIGGMRPQSFEQARPLHTATPPPPLHHQVPPQHYESSPFEDPAYYQPPQHHPNTYDHQVPYDPPMQNTGFSMPDPSHYGSPAPDHRF